MTQKYNNNLSVLPFHRTLGEQAHRRSYAYGDIYPLYTPLGLVPPFQIRYVPTVNIPSIEGVYLRKPDGTLADDITELMMGVGLAMLSYDGYRIIRFTSPVPRNITTAEGQYYLEIEMNDGQHFYSDVFTVTAITAGFLTVQWFDDEDFVMDGTRIVYYRNDGTVQDPIRRPMPNYVFLKTELGKPDYEFDEEGENRDGFFFPEKMVSSKKYKFTFLANEALCDVMRFACIADFVTVIDQYGIEYRCDTFLMTPKWQEMGNVASVDVEFTTDTVAKKLGVGFHGLDSYNDDFNNDYDITATT